MINNKLLYYKTKDGYVKDASNISSESIVFIEDDGTIRTHNKTFGQPLTADEDNLTVKNNVITVKNRTSDRGRGYVVLKKDDDFVSSVVDQNTTYVIKYDYVLNEGLNLPKDVTLKFEGGSLTGGSIVGHGAYIDAPTDHKIFNNVLVGGSFYNRYLPIEWFGFQRGTISGVNSFNLKGTVKSVDNLPQDPQEYDAYAIGHDVYVYYENRDWIKHENIISSKALDIQALQLPKNISIIGTSIEYNVSDDGQNAPATGWSKAILATSKDYPYMWTRTTVDYSDGTNTTSYSVAYSSRDGKDQSVFTIKGYAGGHFKTTSDLLASNPPQIEGDVIYLIDEPPTHITILQNGNVLAGHDKVAKEGDAYIITTTDDSGTTSDTTWIATTNGWFTISTINNVPGTSGASIDRTISYWALNTTPDCPPSSQFTKTQPVMTPSKPYLWCYQIFYLTNGRSIGGYENAYLAGVYGKTGNDGDSCTPIYYFLLSNKNSGIARNTPGWTVNSAQSPNESNKYLWCYIELRWSNKTTTYVEPFIIAQAGVQGKSGPIAYLAGSWNSTTTYVRKDTVPVVYSGGKYWYLNQEGSFKGKIPGQDSVWSELEKYQVLFTDMLIANAGTINDAVFWDGFMYSKQGSVGNTVVSSTDANQSWRQFDPYNPTTSVKFTDGEFAGKYNFVPNLCLDFESGTLYCDNATISGDITSKPVTLKDYNVEYYWYLDGKPNQHLKTGTIPPYCKFDCNSNQTFILPSMTASEEQKDVVRMYCEKHLRIDNVGKTTLSIKGVMTNKNNGTLSSDVIVLPGQAVVITPHLSIVTATSTEGYSWEYVKFQLV